MSPSLWCGLEAAAGADAQQLLDAELDQLLEDDRRAGAAHAGALHGDALAFVRAGVAEQAALGVPLHDVVEVRLGDVLGPQRVARQQARLGVVARLRSHVDRHPRDPIRQDRGCDAHRRAAAGADPRVLRRGSGRAGLPRGRRPPRARPVQRDRGRTAGSSRSATRARTSSRPGAAAARSRPSRSAPRARMLIGEQRAVTELWEAARRRLPAAREDRPGQPVYAISARSGGRDDAASGPRALRPRPARSRVRARPRGRARHRSAPARRRRLPLADAGADRGGPLVALGGGRRRSSSRRRRRRGRRRRCSCSRSGPIPRRAGAGNAERGLRDLIRLLLERVPTVCLFVRAENEAAIALYDSVGMSHVLDYRSVLL